MILLLKKLKRIKNHVHMIINCNPRYGVMKCIQLIKSTTAIILFKEFPYIYKEKIFMGW